MRDRTGDEIGNIISLNSQIFFCRAITESIVRQTATVYGAERANLFIFIFFGHDL